MQDKDMNQPLVESDLDEGLTELMKAHLDDVTGGAAARHNSWKQTV
jgi:hypothetical protein